MLSRRNLIGKLAAGFAGAVVASTAGAKVGEAKTTSSGWGFEPLADGTDGPPPWDLVRPLNRGAVVARGWRVADLSSVAAGSCVLTLQNARGRAFRVHVCRNNGQPQGLAHTENFDLLVMNGGQGDRRTEEGLAKAVAAVARVIAANERTQSQQRLVARMMPHAERVERFADSVEAELL